MRNRQLIANWVLAHANPEKPEVAIVEIAKQVGNINHDGPCEVKHFLQIRDYQGLRRLYGELLAEIQRITSEGDYAAAKEMVETYAVKVNPDLHKEVLERYKKLNLAPYKGFVNPVYHVTRNDAGEITDVQLDFTEGYIDQHLRYSRDYSPLPSVN
jgi:dipeptidyl-peptidase-3